MNHGRSLANFNLRYVDPTPPTQNHTNPNHDAYFTNINLDEEISVARSNYSSLNNEQQPIVDTIFNDLQQYVYGPSSSYDRPVYILLTLLVVPVKLTYSIL